MRVQFPSLTPLKNIHLAQSGQSTWLRTKVSGVQISQWMPNICSLDATGSVSPLQGGSCGFESLSEYHLYAVCPGGEGAVLKTVGCNRLAGSNPVHGASDRGERCQKPQNIGR